MITDNQAKERAQQLLAKIRKEHPAELVIGAKVELEHTDDPAEAEVIAVAHIDENPNYYELLLSLVEKVSPFELFEDLAEGFADYLAKQGRGEIREIPLLDQWKLFKQWKGSIMPELNEDAWPQSKAATIQGLKLRQAGINPLQDPIQAIADSMDDPTGYQIQSQSQGFKTGGITVNAPRKSVVDVQLGGGFDQIQQISSTING